MSLPNHPNGVVQYLLRTLIFRRLPGIILGTLIGFGLVLTANAEESHACALGLLQCDENGVVWNFAILGADNVAQLSGSDGLAEAILAFGYFLNRIIIPFLLALALLIFLYYLARTFIIDATYTDKREEAKKRALWGFAAFILIASIWGVVNLLVNGLRIDQERSLCPDYLGNWCGNLGEYSGESNLNFGNPSKFDVNLGGYSNSDGTQPQPQSNSALGELLFGSYRDQASFNFRSGAPRAAESAVVLATTTTCVAGLNTLQTSAAIEPLQSAYLLYRDDSNQVRWLNVTDSTAETKIAYDVDTMQPYITQAGDTNVVLVHTHPQATISKLGLTMTGYGPSISDMELMCDDVVNNARFVVVDWNNVWVLESTGATCPRRSREVDALPIISTLTQLALIDSNNRESALEQILTFNDLPPNALREIRNYRNVNFSDITSTDILLLADELARDGNFKITRQTIDDFCTTF